MEDDEVSDPASGVDVDVGNPGIKGDQIFEKFSDLTVTWNFADEIVFVMVWSGGLGRSL